MNVKPVLKNITKVLVVADVKDKLIVRPDLSIIKPVVKTVSILKPKSKIKNIPTKPIIKPKTQKPVKPNIKNRGTGAGGAKTNKNGLKYEDITDLKTHFEILKLIDIQKKLYLMGVMKNLLLLTSRIYLNIWLSILMIPSKNYTVVKVQMNVI